MGADFLSGALTAWAGRSWLDSTQRATNAAFGSVSATEALVAENAVLRDGLAEWERYARALEEQNAALRAELRSRSVGE